MQDFHAVGIPVSYRPPGTIADRNRMYRLLIDCTETCGLAAVLCPF
jgi:hypothetical protein